MINLSKNRKFPDNYYEIYKLGKHQIGNFLNTWFVGKILQLSDLEKYKVKLKRGELNDYLLSDEIWTVKKTDSETSSILYHRKINPISISIYRRHSVSSKQESDGNLYVMNAMIHSIDDSSFGIWWDDEKPRTINELKEIRKGIMYYINNSKCINGKSFLNACIELDANKETIDYN